MRSVFSFSLPLAMSTTLLASAALPAFAQDSEGADMAAPVDVAAPADDDASVSDTANVEPPAVDDAPPGAESTAAEPTDGESSDAEAAEPPSPPPPPPPSSTGDEELDAYIEARVQAELDRRLASAFDDKLDEKLQQKKEDGFFDVDWTKMPISFDLRGDFFTKFLTRNNASGGCVSYGNPAPEGDNFSGDNGICSELGLTINGKVSEYVDMGARLQSRYGAQWANWWENGDEKARVDGSGESLGLNHASYMQLRGIYLRARLPIPFLDNVHIGATDLAMFNAWTVGKIRFTERDNARAVLLNGSFGDFASFTAARVSLPKLFAGPGYNTGIDDANIANPFWERDAVYALKLRSDYLEWFSVEGIASYVLDEEADLDDPDAIGSTNTLDNKDGVVFTNARYQNVNATLQVESNYIDWLSLKSLFGYSYSRTHPDLVFNSVSGAQGFTPVPMGEHHGYAIVARANVYDPLDWGLELAFEYFNIGAGWVSVVGQRREGDVLLTDGFLDGQLPTLNIANEFMDFNEDFYESIVGWHGATATYKWDISDVTLGGELTYIDYNTDTGTTPRDTDETFPDFLYTDGMTDDEFFNFANTNDRGRDPRSVYKKHQNRMTFIVVNQGSYTLDVFDGIVFKAKQKTILDLDQRDQTNSADDYLGVLTFNNVAVATPLTDELSFELGAEVGLWFEQHRSGDALSGYPNYTTIRPKVYSDLRYTYGGLTFWYHIEYINKLVDVSTGDGLPDLASVFDPHDNPRDFAYFNVVRSMAMVTASF